MRGRKVSHNSDALATCGGEPDNRTTHPHAAIHELYHQASVTLSQHEANTRTGAPRLVKQRDGVSCIRGHSYTSAPTTEDTLLNTLPGRAHLPSQPCSPADTHTPRHLTAAPRHASRVCHTPTWILQATHLPRDGATRPRLDYRHHRRHHHYHHYYHHHNHNHYHRHHNHPSRI
ncbi:hypothetical protein E2C01_056838 [Portunus trituberculatus]|uniref:Uncharacterized protein n=1 Tax=Portunus trituberculatus TaxID=210409 RepID=A0A5B7H0N6_PORTR|nr:hypothetical protein [Portunus trituberculatus]